MRPIHKNTVKRILRNSGVWSGYIAQSNVNSFHIKNGWVLGYPVTVHSAEELDKIIDQFHSYNNDPELGHRVRLWEDK